MLISFHVAYDCFWSTNKSWAGMTETLWGPLSSFTVIKRLFSSSLLSAIRIMSSAYLRLLIFLPAILIPACASSSLAFHMMCFAYKLNKQGDNIQPWRTPFPIWNQSVVPCPVLTVASWPTYRFLRRQVRWSGRWYSHLLKNFPQFVVIYNVDTPKTCLTYCHSHTFVWKGELCIRRPQFESQLCPLWALHHSSAPLYPHL